jgi:hypothetical protein
MMRWTDRERGGKNGNIYIDEFLSLSVAVGCVLLVEVRLFKIQV